MLILTRKVDEEIVILLEDGREIVIMPTEIRTGNNDGAPRVRLGITADTNIIVHRREVLDRIEAERAASQTPSFDVR